MPLDAMHLCSAVRRAVLQKQEERSSASSFVCTSAFQGAVTGGPLMGSIGHGRLDIASFVGSSIIFCFEFPIGQLPFKA